MSSDKRSHSCAVLCNMMLTRFVQGASDCPPPPPRGGGLDKREGGGMDMAGGDRLLYILCWRGTSMHITTPSKPALKNTDMHKRGITEDIAFGRRSPCGKPCTFLLS